MQQTNPCQNKHLGAESNGLCSSSVQGCCDVVLHLATLVTLHTQYFWFSAVTFILFVSLHYTALYGQKWRMSKSPYEHHVRDLQDVSLIDIALCIGDCCLTINTVLNGQTSSQTTDMMVLKIEFNIFAEILFTYMYRKSRWVGVEIYKPLYTACHITKRGIANGP